MAERESLSLYKEIHARGYEAAIVATHNINFAFTSGSFLRRLQSVAGITRCSWMPPSVVSGWLTHLIPAVRRRRLCVAAHRAGGAFHPKFVFRRAPEWPAAGR